MNLPPALTWLQLFPRGCAVACESGPEWFRQMLRRRDATISPRILCVWDKAWHQLDDLPNWDGVAAVNCSSINARRLQAAGFSYVRRFAVLPSIEHARWFISLDSSHVAAGSFNLYTPARSSARLKKSLATLAARLHLPIWYRDTIVIASRKPPPLEMMLAKLFPDTPLRLGLSAGAPEPAINRKASAAVLAPDGNALAFVKIAGTPVSRRIMEHEARTLGALADRTRLREGSPRLLFADEVDGRYVTVQTPLAGKPALAKLTPAHRQFLTRLQAGPGTRAAATSMVATLPQRIIALRSPQPELSASLDQVMPTLEQTTIPSTIVHGDFAPWNVRISAGQISAFDWEYAELDGLPLIDETHYSLQLGYLLQDWDVEAANRCLLDLAAAKPLGLAPEQVRAIHAVYLLDNIVRLLGEGYDVEHEMVSWYRQLLTRIGAPQRQAVLV